ncbi:MAG: alpha/beta hydrolase [Clostridiales bacterium]|nr:alpha/beta hydrolase [Clostridiales bacterium]
MSYYDDILKRWPIPYKSRMVETRYGDTHILEMGDGEELLVLLHGSTSNSSMWIGEVSYLKKYKILAIDIPGEPNRSTEERFDLEDDSFSLWVEDCMKHYDKPFHLVGNSLGAG